MLWKLKALIHILKHEVYKVVLIWYEEIFSDLAFNSCKHTNICEDFHNQYINCYQFIATARDIHA